MIMAGVDDKEAVILKMIQSLDESHGGFAGKSLVEQIREDLDTVFSDPDREFNLERHEFSDIADDKFAEGIAHALGVLRGTSADEEWRLAEERYSNARNRQ